MKARLVWPVTIGIFLVFPSLLLHADEAHPPTVSDSVLSFTHLWADAQGVSHFRDETLSFEAATPNHVGPVALRLQGASGATFLYLKRGAIEDWHKAPRRMYLIAVQGMSEVTAGDGEVRRFGPGSIMLMDDLIGKGHITRVIGDADHIALTIPTPAAK